MCGRIYDRVHAKCTLLLNGKHKLIRHSYEDIATFGLFNTKIMKANSDCCLIICCSFSLSRLRLLNTFHFIMLCYVVVRLNRGKQILSLDNVIYEYTKHVTCTQRRFMPYICVSVFPFVFMSAEPTLCVYVSWHGCVCL